MMLIVLLIVMMLETVNTSTRLSKRGTRKVCRIRTGTRCSPGYFRSGYRGMSCCKYNWSVYIILISTLYSLIPIYSGYVWDLIIDCQLIIYNYKGCYTTKRFGNGFLDRIFTNILSNI